ncbi:COP9 signalosome complex subunit 8 [Phytophthora cinnamomi]|uniref:COP9 signalosome complex subunit 8 n=1 Tax=Phytophthora cinnamomi TaxID=4785 RepID=UPI00355A0C59|nr:COP9 signalosome complex subunit 8 [Phytophthora cinnamomi]
METRKSVRRRTAGLKAAAARGVASDAESTVSTRSSNSSKSNSSSTSRRQNQRQLKTERLSSRGNGSAGATAGGQEQVEGEEDAGDQLRSLAARLGAILETTEVQLTMILLIALDVCCTVLEMHLHDQQQLAAALQQLNGRGEEGSASLNVVGTVLVRIATRLVQSFTGFTLFLFLTELAIMLAAFRRQFFAHAGYVLDMLVVGMSLAMEVYASSKAVRLLGILRVWRVLRLIRRLVDQERAAHNATRLQLEQEQLKLLHVRMQKDAAHESLKREYESRSGLEQLLRSYKDEIVTLKEALQIAAQAVAEATMSESVSVNPSEFAEDAAAESSVGSYFVAAGTEGYQYQEDAYATYPQAEAGANYWGVERAYQHEDEAAAHSAETTAEPWTRGDSGYQVQDAAAVHPAALHELEEEHWQEGVDHHLETAAPQVAVHPAEMLEHGKESEREEFEDAVDE